MKNKIPPHEESAVAKNNPATINLIIEILPLLNFNPETKRYIAIIAKNNPNGSDLNQPKPPLIIIGNETAKNIAAKRPAVVPANTLTKAKITITDNEPKTTGNIIVKS